MHHKLSGILCAKTKLYWCLSCRQECSHWTERLKHEHFTIAENRNQFLIWVFSHFVSNRSKCIRFEWIAIICKCYSVDNSINRKFHRKMSSQKGNFGFLPKKHFELQKIIWFYKYLLLMVLLLAFERNGLMIALNWLSMNVNVSQRW